MRHAIVDLQDAGVEADIWKIEGIDSQEDCERIARRPPGATAATASSAWCSAAAPTTRRSSTGCATGAPVEGYAGFAIGRTIWWDALKGFLDGDLERDDAVRPDLREVPAVRAGVRGGRAGARRRMSALLRVP